MSALARTINRYSQASNRSTSRSVGRSRHARTRASWVASSASSVSRRMRRAIAYNRSTAPAARTLKASRSPRRALSTSSACTLRSFRGRPIWSPTGYGGAPRARVHSSLATQNSGAGTIRPMTSEMGRWGFADPGPLRAELTALALAGTKTTTASLLVDFEIEGAALPVPGQRDLLVDSDDRPVAVVETLSCRVVRLADVDDEHAIDEGEGYANAAEFRVEHESYWNSYLDTIREHLGDPSFVLTDDTIDR